MLKTIFRQTPLTNSNYVHGGNVELLAPKYGFGIDEIIDFSANINPFAPPPGIEELIEKSWPEIARYPDPDSRLLRQVLASWHAIEPENLAAGNGVSELIYWIPRLFSFPQALIFAPAFTEYAKAVQAAGGTVRYRIADEKNDFYHPFVGVSANVNLVFMGNPNNPTGKLYPKSLLEKWIDEALEKFPETFFVIDESFLPFVPDEKPYSLIPFAIKRAQVILLRSMTKIFAIPGLRLGYAIAQDSTVLKLNRLMPAWRVNILAQRFGEHLYDYLGFLHGSVRRLRTAREELFRELREIELLTVFESFSNFLLIKILRDIISASKLTEEFAKKGILVRCCDDFVGLEKERFIRIAVRKPEENKHLVKVLKELLK